MTNASQNITELNTTIESYLRGCVGFDVSDNAINSILIDRELVPNLDIRDIDKRTKELCKAD